MLDIPNDAGNRLAATGTASNAGNAESTMVVAAILCLDKSASA
jgi:hypothetical protein